MGSFFVTADISAELLSGRILGITCFLRLLACVHYFGRKIANGPGCDCESVRGTFFARGEVPGTGPMGGGGAIGCRIGDSGRRCRGSYRKLHNSGPDPGVATQAEVGTLTKPPRRDDGDLEIEKVNSVGGCA